MTRRAIPRVIAIPILLMIGLTAPPAAVPPLAAQEKIHRDEQKGIEFRYPEKFVVGAFKRQPFPAELKERGYESPFQHSIVLVEMDQLQQFSRDAIPVGEIPALWLDVQSGMRAKFTEKQFFKAPFRITLGGRTVYRLPGYPGPYGDQAHYYLLPLDDGRILEAAAHRYYFRSAEDSAGNPPDTHYGEVLESILESLTFDAPQ